MELILGVDDSGRGPVIGPMIMAGCLIDKKIEPEFRRLGVKDSKQLTKKRREFLADIIRQKAIAFELEVIHPEEIDKLSASGTNLNDVEAILASKIVNRINKGFGKIKLIVDCPSPNRTAWQDFLKTKIDDLSNLSVSCEHKADRNHIAVSAASILAKEERERQMDFLRDKYGKEIGSGYGTDPKTQEFLKKNVKHLKHDGIFRKSWKTWKNADSNSKQKKLEF